MADVQQPPADFLAQVDAATIVPGQIALWYIGGAGFIVRTPSTTLYIDPFCGPSIDENWVRGLAPPFDPARIRVCDGILSTHEHLDHCDPVALVPMLTSTRATLFGPATSIEMAAGFGWPANRLHALTWGDSTTVGDIKITTIKSVDPMAKGCNGYVMESQGIIFVNMGDSLWYDDIGKQMAPWKIDAICLSVALNPPGETLYMSEIDAVRIARDVGAKVLIPHHWDLWQRVALDPRRIATVAPWYAPDTIVRPTRFCQRISLIRAGEAIAIGL